MEHTGKSNKKVIVIGASMAGLLVARVLADHFEQVVLVDKDTFPASGENRKGVPQGRHVHALLERGRIIMEEYLPGLTDELVRLGASYVKDASLNVSWYHSGFHKPGVSDIQGIGVTRPTLEAAVRARVIAHEHVQNVGDCKVMGLRVNDDNSRVTGIRFISPQNGSREETLEADLVVDASGRGSHSPVWLEELGYQCPEEEEVCIGVGYTTCLYRRKPEHIRGLDGMLILAKPSSKSLGVIMGVDGNRWIVTMGGYLGNHAPGDYPGFLKFAGELPVPHIYDVIKDAEPLTEPARYKFTANLRRHYEKLTRFPEGYLVLGDAMCSFNPVYGQGMTVAAMEAKALGECLDDGTDRLWKRFFKKAGSIIDIPWSLTVGNDLSFPEVQGRRTLMTRFVNWYIDKLHQTACKDAGVSIAFLKVTNMMAPPPSILHPRIAWRILKDHLMPGSDTSDHAVPENLVDLFEEKHF